MRWRTFASIGNAATGWCRWADAWSMRVIAGEFRSRKLKTLPGLATRPTPDRLRETLFNILQSRLDEAIFLDAYAGTGAVGIEALSRGARRAIFVDRSRAAVEVIRENLAALGLSGRCEVFCGKAIQLIERMPSDIAFIDPPYELENEYAIALNELSLSNASLVIAQHAFKAKLAPDYNGLSRTREVKQGDNVLSFYERISARGSEPLLHGRGSEPCASASGGQQEWNIKLQGEKMPECKHLDQIKNVKPHTHGCEECLKMGDRWVHLRLCLSCGHVGCCDSSKNKHATKHFHATQHPIMRSIEPGEDWGWCFVDEMELDFA